MAAAGAEAVNKISTEITNLEEEESELPEELEQLIRRQIHSPSWYCNFIPQV